MAQYYVLLGTLRDYEQRRSEPDQPAQSVLKVIAHDPAVDRSALQKTKYYSDETRQKDTARNITSII